MLTLCALPKRFEGHFGVIQRNAIESWLRLEPRCEVVLLGDDPGVAEFAKERGLRHVPDIARTPYGTPRVDAVFRAAEASAGDGLVCYVNADIILMDDFPRAVQRVLREAPEAVMIGRRRDLDVTDPLSFSPGWQDRLREDVRARGRLHAHTGIDYYVFRRGAWPEIPPFGIGRWMWDSWLVYDARRRGLPVVDLTDATCVIHQNHDYSHAKDPAAVKASKGDEVRKNVELAGGASRAYTILDSTHVLTRRGLRRRRSPYALYRALVEGSERHASLRPIVRAIRRVRGNPHRD